MNPFPNGILGIDKKHGRLTGPYSVEFGPYRMQHTLCYINYVEPTEQFNFEERSKQVYCENKRFRNSDFNALFKMSENDDLRIGGLQLGYCNLS